MLARATPLSINKGGNFHPSRDGATNGEVVPALLLHLQVCTMVWKIVNCAEERMRAGSGQTTVRLTVPGSVPLPCRHPLLPYYPATAQAGEKFGSIRKVEVPLAAVCPESPREPA